MSEINALYQELILDHGRSPRNFGEIKDAEIHQVGYNPLCGDTLTLYLKLNADKKISEVKFTGHGCAISVASASMMTEVLKGHTLAEALALVETFRHLVMDGKINSEEEAKLGKLTVLKGVKEFPSRVKCATLAWHTLASGIKGDQEQATTE